MDTHHILFECRVWREKRRKMRKRCQKEVEGQPRRVRLLLGSRKAIPTLLDFIATIRAGQRARIQKQDKKRQEKERDETWGLDKERSEGDEERDMEG